LQQAPAWFKDLFAAIDASDAKRFAGYMAPDGVFRFANAPPVHRRAAIEAAVAGFFATIRSSRHQLQRCWRDADSYAVQGTVTYTRLDGRELTVPFVDVFVMRGEQIAEYLIYIDITPLYAP
jgi:ketosteroid isomerase-like protein